MLFDFMTDINANEATEDMEDAVQDEIPREQEQKIDHNNVPQGEIAG